MEDPGLVITDCKIYRYRSVLGIVKILLWIVKSIVTDCQNFRFELE